MARILLCVGGGISAYKAPALVRAFVGRGHEVQVLMTDAAGAFVTELSLTTVSKRPVRRSLLDAAAEGSVGHIDLADWPDQVVVAPATANLMARAAHGLADDLVTTVLLATRAPITYAPAMNTNMWAHAATRANVATLAERGARFVGPDAGDLACGWVGEGRMMDPELIVDAVERAANTPSELQRKWAERHVLVSAGPTRAYLDPVRFISNASTGSMGVAIAQAALDRGAQVTLVAGPLQVPGPKGARLTRIDVETAGEMLEAMRGVMQREQVDAVAMVAAVADLRPASGADQKMSKDAALEAFAQLEWAREPDVLATLRAEAKAADHPTFFLGFAAQTIADDGEAGREALLNYAREKLERKGVDAVFVNRVGVPGLGFASATNAGWWVESSHVEGSGPKRPKAELGAWLVDRVGHALETRGPRSSGDLAS